MNKLILISLALLLYSGSSLYAQDDEVDLSAGTTDMSGLLVEITSTPFAGSVLVDFSAFRLKYSLDGSITPRLGIFLDHDSRQTTPDAVTTSSTYTFTPGVEIGFTQEGKFSSYIGADVVVGIKGASAESVNGSVVDGTIEIPDATNDELRPGERGYFQLGLAASFGFNHQLGSHIYVGSEIGFQVLRTSYSEVSVDGELFQESTVAYRGILNTANTFRIGFKF